MSDLSVHIPIDKIEIPADRVRPVDPGVVEFLVEDIASKGQLQPIGVRPVAGSRLEESGERYILIFGEHRLRAITKIPFAEIEAKIFNVTEAQALVMEIDENLIRSELKPLELAEALGRRRTVYEEAYPHSKNGAMGLLVMNNEPDGQADQLDKVPSFMHSAAEHLGVSRRSVARLLEIGEIVLFAQERIKGSGHDLERNKTQLLALSKASADDQLRIAELILCDEAKNVSDAHKIISGVTDAPTEDDKAVSRLKSTFSKASTAAKLAHLDNLSKIKLPGRYKIWQGDEYDDE